MKKQRSTSQPWSQVRLVSYNEKVKKIVRQISTDAMENPTYAMMEQLKAMQSRSVLPPPNSSPRRKGWVILILNVRYIFKKKPLSKSCLKTQNKVCQKSQKYDLTCFYENKSQL